MGRLIFYIVATSYLRRGRRDVNLRDQDVLRKWFAEWGAFSFNFTQFDIVSVNPSVSISSSKLSGMQK